jgi:predicted NUDIX family NTP pyrophosphohydrolase
MLAMTESYLKAESFFFTGEKANIAVLIGHPGAHFWRKKDLRAWSVPKG